MNATPPVLRNVRVLQIVVGVLLGALLAVTGTLIGHQVSISAQTCYTRLVW